MVIYLAYGSTANFRFRGSIAKINISKERQDYGDRSGLRILEIDSVIQKLSRFPQVQSERERTLVIGRAKRAPHWGVQSRFRVIYVGMSVVVQKSVGGITWAKRAHAQSQYWAVKSYQ